MQQFSPKYPTLSGVFQGCLHIFKPGNSKIKRAFPRVLLSIFFKLGFEIVTKINGKLKKNIFLNCDPLMLFSSRNQHSFFDDFFKILIGSSGVTTNCTENKFIT